MANEWGQKFTCDGNCISLDKLNDSVPDCTYHCVENNKSARKTCEVTRSKCTATVMKVLASGACEVSYQPA